MEPAINLYSSNEKSELIRENSQEILSVLAAHQIALWEYDIITGECSFSDDYFSTLGLKNAGVLFEDIDSFYRFVHPDDTSAAKGNKDYVKLKTEPAIRFAEILLIYAEALNELEDGSSYDIPSWDGSASYSVKRDINEMKKGIRPVRCRAGVPDYTLPEYQEAMEIYGCDALMTEENRAAFHSPIVVNELPAAFSRKLYFWPISHEELKRNKLLTQNPGWTYND